MSVAKVASLTKIAQGREAEIFEWEPGVVLKLYRNAAWAHLPQIELAAMTAVREAGGPAPRALRTVEVEGRAGILMERVEGLDMLTRIEKGPWRVVRTGTVMGRLQAALHAAQAPAILDAMKDRLQRQISSIDDAPPAMRQRGLQALDRMPNGDRLCHGDFHPGNVIVAGERTVVIDWPNATSGDPAADVARTLLLMRMGELPPGTPGFIRKIEHFGRAILIRRYLRAYAKETAIDRARIDAWTLPLAIARLSEGIVEERPRVLALIDSLPDPL